MELYWLCVGHEYGLSYMTITVLRLRCSKEPDTEMERYSGAVRLKVGDPLLVHRYEEPMSITSVPLLKRFLRRTAL